MDFFPIFPALFREVSLLSKCHAPLRHQPPVCILGIRRALVRWEAVQSQTCAPLKPEAFNSSVGIGAKRTSEEIEPKSVLPGPADCLTIPAGTAGTSLAPAPFH